MLRPKHIGALSQCARSFILSGSRNSAADGSSCTCSDDETCISRRKDTRNTVTNAFLHAPSTSTLRAAEASARAEILISADAAKAGGYQKADSVKYQDARPQVVAAAEPISQADCVSYAKCVDSVKDEVGHLSLVTSDQLVKAGISTVNILSDLMNYKLPISAGGGTMDSPQNYMVDPTRPVSSISSPNVKPIKRDNIVKVHPKSSSSGYGSSGSKNSCDGGKGKDDKPGLVRGSKHLSDKGLGHPLEAHNLSSDTRGKKPISEKSRASHNYNTSKIRPNDWNADAKTAEAIREDVKRPAKDPRMCTRFVPVGRQFLNTGHVVESVSNILKRNRWGPVAEEVLRNLHFSIDAYQANQILKQIQDYSVALGFFHWLKRQPGFKHDGHTYTTMVGILGRARQFNAINKLLDQMVMDGCEPNVVTYNRLIHSYGRANYLNEALRVFTQMQEAGCEPDRVTYCTLIDIHAKAGFLDVAMQMYQKMQEAGLTPDTFTYSVMINCLGKAGNLTAAHKLYCEMIDQGCVPNIVTYNIMIALQAKARNYQTALNLYRQMQNSGFAPDRVTYSIVMEVLGHCGYLEEAEALVVEMRRNNWVPDEPVYGLLVDMWGKSGNIEKACGWYHAMLNAGLRPNVPTCNSLLSAFLRLHRLLDAHNLLHTMLSFGLIPSLQTYTLLLSCCTEAQSRYDMGFCCQLMAMTGHPAHVFLQSMPPSGPDGKNFHDHVSEFFDMMHTEDRESKRGLVDAVVDFLHKSGLKEEAGSVWEVAALKNVYPDAVKEKSSSYWLINLHVMSDGTAVTALSRTLAWFRRQMLSSGICPSRIDIVTGWGRRSRVTGSSLVRQAVEELLNMFSFPFFTQNGNSGCFVGCGEPLNRWLLHSYVERMHLL